MTSLVKLKHLVNRVIELQREQDELKTSISNLYDDFASDSNTAIKILREAKKVVDQKLIALGDLYCSVNHSSGELDGINSTNITVWDNSQNIKPTDGPQPQPEPETTEKEPEPVDEEPDDGLRNCPRCNRTGVRLSRERDDC
jgi:hypothetical protein